MTHMKIIINHIYVLNRYRSNNYNNSNKKYSKNLA